MSSSARWSQDDVDEDEGEGSRPNVQTGLVLLRLAIIDGTVGIEYRGVLAARIPPRRCEKNGQGDSM